MMLNVFANYYYNFGFNITCIKSVKSKYTKEGENYLKAPSHKWLDYINQRLALSVMQRYDWHEATGLGVVLGFDKLRAIDIDCCSDLSLMDEFLEKLYLPPNYEWIVRSGSQNGFHILFYADNLMMSNEFDGVYPFKSNSENCHRFEHLEYRWKGHLVLPPSIHRSYKKYEFISHRFPLEKPYFVEKAHLVNLLDTYCSNKPYGLISEMR